MKYFVYVLLFVFSACGTTSNPKVESNQSTESKKEKIDSGTGNDKELKSDNPNFQLSVYVPKSENLPESATKLVENKLNQILTKNGVGGNMPNPRFAIVPVIIVLSKNITNTAPTMHANNYQVTFYIGDVVNKILFSSISIEFKGVGETEAEAFKTGFQSIKNEDKNIQKIIEEGKQKIIDFYNSKCDLILKDAENLAQQGKYDDAIAQLMLVPDECEKCFEQARSKVEPIYKNKINNTCNQILAKMKAETGKYNTDKALDLFVQIPNDASCFNEANTMIDKHIGSLKPDEKKKWDVEMLKYKDEQVYKTSQMKAIEGVANNFLKEFSLVGYAQATAETIKFW